MHISAFKMDLIIECILMHLIIECILMHLIIECILMHLKCIKWGFLIMYQYRTLLNK